MKFINLVVLLGISLFNISSYGAKLEKEYWLFVGNPGAGKSTIINSLLKQELAEAGACVGGGLTKEFALYPDRNITYIDTPGLDDVKSRALAAKEIEKALKQDGKYRIFFIMKTDGLRVRPADLATIEIVLDAINNPNIEFNIIINQFTKRDQKKFDSTSDVKSSALFHSYLQAGKYKNSKIKFINLDNAVQDGDSEFLNMDDFLSFVDNRSASIHLLKDSIGTVNGQSWDEKLDKAETDLKQAKIDFQTQKNKADEAEQKVKDLQADIKKEKEINWGRLIGMAVAGTVIAGPAGGIAGASASMMIDKL